MPLLLQHLLHRPPNLPHIHIYPKKVHVNVKKVSLPHSEY